MTATCAGFHRHGLDDEHTFHVGQLSVLFRISGSLVPKGALQVLSCSVF
jgi:hypothetical protein